MERVSSFVVAGAVLVGACGSGTDSQVLPYSANLTAVIGGAPDPAAGPGVPNTGKHSGRVRMVDTPDGDECVDEAAEPCLKPQMDCGDDGATDMLVDAHGQPLATLCYPTTGVSVSYIDGSLSKVGNNTVFVLDDIDDGADITGNVTIDGNNVVLYGHGPDVSMIAGDLHIDKNNARVRGIHVQGDVVIDKNNPSIVDCIIEGDLIIHGNNVAVALCDVWGDIVVDGNNALLVEDRLAGEVQVHGNNLSCSGNLSFEDADDDGVISDEELGDAIVCTPKN